MRLTKCCIALALAVLPAPAGARAAWNQPVGGEQPLNRAAADPASHASLAAVGATPWVAWVEDHDNGEVRAARLKADGSGWDRAPDTANPINRSEAGDAELPSITAHGGVPCVAWDEFDGVNTEVRVACRNGDDWERVADSASPINFDAGQDGSDPSLASFNGTLYVAWSELNSSNVSQIHVARQNGNAWEKVPASSLNRNVTHNAHNPSLAVVGTQLHVAWNENDGTSNKIRVSRFNGSGWDPVADTTGGLNQNPAMNAADPSLADIGGIPHVAWSEIDGDGHRQIRVAKLEGGTAWVKVGQDDNPTSPINKSFNHDAEHPSLAGIGSPARPYVAWTEVDANGVSQVRVAQLKASGTGWERVADSASPINHASQESAANASLAAVGGVPWVAWTERDPDSTTQNRIDQARVTRLEPSFAGASATDVAQTGATLTVEATTYGLPYPIGFAYGPSLGQSTTPQPAPTGQGDTVTFSQPVTGLTAATEYQFRPFATAGTASPPVLGQTASFTTASPPPTCTPVSKTTAHETAVNLTLQCAGQGTLAYEVVSGPAHGQLSGLDSAAGTVTYTPNAAFSGQDSFTYRATNTGGASNTATVTIEVTPPPPACNDVSTTTAFGTAVQVTLQCAGQGTLAYEVVSGPAHGQLSGLDSAAGTVTYTPNAAFSGQDSFTYRATNTGGASNTATVTIEVTPPPPPACNDVSTTTAFGTAVQVTLQCAGQGTLAYEIVSGPGAGQLSGLDPAGGTVTYTPGATFSGHDSFTYRATNSGGASATARALITVEAGPSPIPLQPLSSDFQLGKVKRNKRKGNATIAVTVPMSGTVELAKTKKVKGAHAGVVQSLQVELPVRPSAKTKRKLRKRGKARIGIRVTYTPDGGQANTKRKRARLVRR